MLFVLIRLHTYSRKTINFEQRQTFSANTTQICINENFYKAFHKRDRSFPQNKVPNQMEIPLVMFLSSQQHKPKLIKSINNKTNYNSINPYKKA